MDLARFTHRVLALLGGQVSRLVVQAAYFVVLARMLGPTGYGALAALLAIVALVSPFGAIGLNTLMLRNVSRDHGRAQVEWTRAMFYTIIGGIALTALLCLFSFSVLPDQVTVIAVLFIGAGDLIGLKLIELSGTLRQALGSNRQLLLMPTLLNILRLSAALIAWQSIGQVDLVAWAAVYALVTVPLGLILSLSTSRALGVGKRFMRLGPREVRDGALYSVSVSSQTAFNDLDKVLIASMDSASGAGIYSAGYRVIDMAYAPIRSVAAAAYPLFFQAGEGGIRAAFRLTKKISPLVLLFGALGTSAALVLAPYAPSLLGPGYGEAVLIIQVLAPLILLKGLSFLASDLLTGSDMQLYRTGVQLVLVLVNVILNLILISKFGVMGAVYATLISELLLATFLWLRIFHILGASHASRSEVSSNVEY